MTAPPTPMLTEPEQFQVLNMLDYLADLITASPKEVFSRDEILILLSLVKKDPDFFGPETVIAQQIATAD